MCDDPISVLHEALASAVHRDLPNIDYVLKRYKKWEAGVHGPNKFPDCTEELCTRRPYGSEVKVTMFLQRWPSTALGYGGLGGAAMTDAYTVLCTMGNITCVYFGGGRLAYRVDYSKMTYDQKSTWDTDINDRYMHDVQAALNTFKGAIEGQVDVI
jgi:hypothetical protein